MNLLGEFEWKLCHSLHSNWFHLILFIYVSINIFLVSPYSCWWLWHNGYEMAKSPSFSTVLKFCMPFQDLIFPLNNIVKLSNFNENNGWFFRVKELNPFECCPSALIMKTARVIADLIISLFQGDKEVSLQWQLIENVHKLILTCTEVTVFQRAVWPMVYHYQDWDWVRVLLMTWRRPCSTPEKKNLLLLHFLPHNLSNELY